MSSFKLSRFVRRQTLNIRIYFKQFE